MDNLAAIQNAYAFLWEKDPTERTIEDYQPFFDLCSDGVVYTLEVPEDMPIYGAGFHGKQAMIELLAAGDPEMLGEMGPRLDEPPEFFGQGTSSDGDRVVVLIKESYKMVKTDEDIRGKRVAIVLDFEEGKIVRIHEFCDLAHVAKAYA